ncbi:MAG: sulfite exporter TauE/SafE family protein [Bosea sp. (in: a-proteobacteria)]
MPDALLNIQLLPAGVSPLVALMLVAVSFLTSALTAAFGIGGGMAMLGALAGTAPPALIVGVHGLVQLGSNTGRAILQRGHVLWPLVWRFFAGSLVGVAIGAMLFQALPTRLLLLMLGLFILAMTWAPKPRIPGLERAGLVAGGTISTFLTMFIGATGPFVQALFLPMGLRRQQLVATHAMCMTIQHALKTLAFVAVGVALIAWLPLIAAMVASGFAGTVLGSKLLDKMSEATFRTVLKVVLTLIGLDLLRQAAGFSLPGLV